MNKASKTRLRLNYPSWPRPRNHWSATGPRNQQPPTPTRERSGSSNSSSTVLHRSDRWAALVRPVPARAHLQILRTSTESSYTSQVSVVRRSDRSKPGSPKITNLTFQAPKQTKLETIATQDNRELTKTSTRGKTHKASAPIRPVSSTGKTGQAGTLGMNNTRESTPPNPTLDLPNCSMDLHKTLGIVGTPHRYSIAKIWSTNAR
jgi:hypothetical protein